MEGGKIGPDHSPDDIVCDGRVPVYRAIAERDDARCIGDALVQGGVKPGRLGKRFPDRYELAFHGLADDWIGQVLLKRLLRRDTPNELTRLDDIVQMASCVRPLHTVSPAF